MYDSIRYTNLHQHLVSWCTWVRFALYMLNVFILFASYSWSPFWRITFFIICEAKQNQVNRCNQSKLLLQQKLKWLRQFDHPRSELQSNEPWANIQVDGREEAVEHQSTATCCFYSVVLILSEMTNPMWINLKRARFSIQSLFLVCQWTTIGANGPDQPDGENGSNLLSLYNLNSDPLLSLGHESTLI